MSAIAFGLDRPDVISVMQRTEDQIVERFRHIARDVGVHYG